MIITAKVARHQSSPELEKMKNWEKYPIRELSRVEKAINRMAKKGYTSMKYKCLHPDVTATLKRNGYRIEEQGNYDYEWIVIDWNETT